MENFHQLVVDRRSIRRYKDTEIEPEKIKTILEAGLLSPTSKSKRAWQFVAVEDKATLARLKECKAAGAVSLGNCQVAVVVAVDTTQSDAWIEDASVAAIIMQLQAEDLGLGSCWVQVRGRFTADGVPAEDVVQECLGIPEHVTPVCIVTLGYKDEERKPQNVEKLKWENVHIGTWRTDAE